MHRHTRSVSALLIVCFLTCACAQHYVGVDTDPKSPLATGGLQTGDYVRVELSDGRLLEGRLQYLREGRYRIGEAEISDDSVVSVSRREVHAGNTSLGAMVLIGILLVAYASTQLDF